MKEHVIYKTYGFLTSKEIESFKKDIQANRIADGEEELTEDQLTDAVYEDVNNSYEYEVENLDRELDGKILAVASLGLWNGRKTGYKILGSNLKEVVSSFGCDDVKIYVKGSNIYFEGRHHDGTNYIEFREIKNADNIDNLTNKLYAGESVSRSQLNYYTKPLGKHVKEIYGF